MAAQPDACTMQEEPFFATVQEAAPLIRENMAESGIGGSEQEVSYQGYFAYERSGMLRLYTLRCNGVLAGWAFFLVTPPVQNRQLLRATCETVFVSKPYRLGLTGYKLLEFAFEQLRLLGAHDVVIAYTLKRRSLRHLYARLGMAPYEILYRMPLNDQQHARRTATISARSAAASAAEPIQQRTEL